MTVSAQFLCRMAGDLAEEHGELAVDIARRAFRDRNVEGDDRRAEFWYLISVLVDDVQRYGLDPEGGPVLH
ncbi:hypothetical protein FHS83_003688 [Rhizomicrobium palustre]|uniref:Uncharacterized protein n=1 Tax=Rhizomicrobium palustre TaxID=189966 RepID=A0A846N5V3_9PROT|nr:hypothetical protein [Rhizomicrobium palustre]NIK90370.1 hypothetical protein [Rhizomicrobium palustre]